MKQDLNKIPSVGVIVRKVINKLILIWIKIQIIAISFIRMLKMLKEYHAKQRNIIKPYTNKVHTAAYKTELTFFIEFAKNNFI